MLKTVVVPSTLGCVRYLDAFGESPTIECYASKTAFKVSTLKKNNTQLSVGDWIKFSGKTRVGKTRNKKTGMVDGVRSYYHNPNDGSNREEWVCLELVEVVYDVVVNFNLVNKLSASMELLRECINGFSNNDQNKDIILSTIDSLNGSVGVLTRVFNNLVRSEDEKNAKPIRLPEISFDDL